jgi:hypothetical protein
LRPAWLTSVISPRLAAAAVIVVAWIVCLILNWPGHFSYDSVAQLSEARGSDYSGIHPPVMSWLLGVADAIERGAAPFVVFDTMLVYGALLALALLGRPGTWLAAPVAAALALTPQLLIYPAIVWKDVLFAGAEIAGFAALAWAAACWSQPARRWRLLAATLVLLTLSALSRQNGAVLLPLAAVAVGWLAGRLATRRRVWIGLGGGLAFLAAILALVTTAGAALQTHVTEEHGAPEQFEHLEIYDIVGAVVRDPTVKLDVLHARVPWLEQVLRGQGARSYSPSRIDTLKVGPLDERHDVAAPIAAQWWDLVVKHPLLYLQVRAEVFGWVLLTPKPRECVMVATGIDGDPDDLADAGLAKRKTKRDEALEAYAMAIASTPVSSHATYAVGGLVLLGLLLRRRRAPDIAVAAMVAGGLAFAASFAVISIACDYRYLYDLDLSVVAGTLYAVATRAWRRDAAAPV